MTMPKQLSVRKNNCTLHVTNCEVVTLLKTESKFCHLLLYRSEIWILRQGRNKGLFQLNDSDINEFLRNNVKSDRNYGRIKVNKKLMKTKGEN